VDSIQTFNNIFEINLKDLEKYENKKNQIFVWKLLELTSEGLYDYMSIAKLSYNRANQSYFLYKKKPEVLLPYKSCI